MFYVEAQTGSNSCAGPQRGGCEHLCLAITSTEHVCKCAIGYNIDPTYPNKCIGKSEFIFYSNHELKGIELYDVNTPINEIVEKTVRFL